MLERLLSDLGDPGWGGSLVSALSFVASITLLPGLFVWFCVFWFCFFFVAILILTQDVIMDVILTAGSDSTSQATRWLSWYGVGLASAVRLPVVVRIPVHAGSLKCDRPKGNGRRPQKKVAIPLLCVFLVWFGCGCVLFAWLLLFLVFVFFLMGQLTGLRAGPLPALLWLSTSRQPCMTIQFIFFLRLNVCNDLAEVMKALDGKKVTLWLLVFCFVWWFAFGLSFVFLMVTSLRSSARYSSLLRSLNSEWPCVCGN